MKERKKSALRKGLLMATACVLVASISVGITLAYLTARSNIKTNVFMSESGIEGKLVEPHFNMNQTNYFSPGETVDKDPTVTNTSSADASMWTGIRLKYFLNPGGTGFVQVDEDTFLEFVAINKTLKETTPAVHGYNTSSSTWTEMADADFNYVENSSSQVLKKDTLAKYFKYNTAIPQNGSTAPIFQSVLPSGDILIPASSDALSGRTIKFDNTVTNGGKAYSAMSDTEKRAFLATVGTQLHTYYFDSFDFRIDIDGYGVKYESTGEASTLNGVIKRITDGLYDIT